MKAITPKTMKLLENTIMIAQGFQLDQRDRGDWFYQRYSDELSGWPGVNRWIGEAAFVFTHVEIELGENWEQLDWITTINAYTERILGSAGGPNCVLPGISALELIARDLMTYPTAYRRD